MVFLNLPTMPVTIVVIYKISQSGCGSCLFGSYSPCIFFVSYRGFPYKRRCAVVQCFSLVPYQAA